MTVSGAKTQTKSAIPDKILEKVSAFPSMPKAGAKLRALLDQKNVPLTEIEKILGHDPGLAANVLRLANSAYSGIPAKVTTLKHALILLDFKRFSKIAVAASMNKIMANAVRWHHYPQGLENSNLHPEIVYLANLLCYSNPDGKSDQDELNKPYSAVLERWGIDSEEYEVFADKARN